jgi:uncharacterized NAD-dependent epimerase/dehydratase family protein
MQRELRFLVIAEGQFGPLTSKTANSCIRYTPERVVAVIDSRRAGRTAQDVLGFGGDILVVSSVAEGLQRKPTALLIGVAPQGGKLPDEWRAMILAAIDAGLDVWSGLHTFIGADPEFAARAAQKKIEIHDLRRPPNDLPVAMGRVRKIDSTIVLTVGTDCNIGKMTSALQIRDGLKARDRSVRFAGTGQTGILIEGWGIGVDAVIADFIAGAAEKLVLDASNGADIVLVEGQGSVIHPGYSGVTLGLIHGSLPRAAVADAHQQQSVDRDSAVAGDDTDARDARAASASGARDRGVAEHVRSLASRSARRDRKDAQANRPPNHRSRAVRLRSGGGGNRRLSPEAETRADGERPGVDGPEREGGGEAEVAPPT